MYTPGTACGLASDTLIVAAPQEVSETPEAGEYCPFGCKPLMLVLASNSSVPVAEGESVMFPATLMLPLKEVARSVGAISESVVAKGDTLVSASRSQGW